MTHGPMHCMPILVINMGGEMVYILEQRLQAQNVGPDKSKKVLQDVLRTMYSPKFIRELFKPQEMYSSSSTREIFNKLAHSSIMRLNESSMDKLYDLMTMGFKHQLQHCAYSGQLLHITINHLEMLKTIGDSEHLTVLIDQALQLAFETYGNMTAGEWLLVRQSLYSFVQGRKIKVSLFLQNSMQNLDGSFMLSCKTGPMPLGSEKPGKIRYYDGSTVDYETSFETPAGAACTPFEPDFHTPLGSNLYAKDLGKVVDMSTMKGPACAAQNVAKALAMQLRHAPADARASAGAKGQAKCSATAELNLLAELMGAAAKAAEAEHGDPSLHTPFRINLFPEDPFEDRGDSVGSRVDTIVLDAASQRKTAKELMDELHLDDGKTELAESKQAKGDAAAGGEDLLELMDSIK